MNDVQQLTPGVSEDIIRYIRTNDLNLSPYIITNLSKYRDNVEPFFHFYYMKDGDQYTAFISEYDNTAQIWVSKTCWIPAISTFLKNKKYSAIYGDPALLELMGYPLSEPPGHISKLITFIPSFDNCEEHLIKYAQTDDEFNQIAELILQDSPLKEVNDVEKMAARIKERSNSKYGRSWIMQKNGKVVSHVATYAEVDNVAVIAGVATDVDYRNRGLATEIVQHACRTLLDDGKDVYLFWFNEQASHMYKKMGFCDISDWGVSVNKSNQGKL